jgi:hypothetical protein
MELLCVAFTKYVTNRANTEAGFIVSIRQGIYTKSPSPATALFSCSSRSMFTMCLEFAIPLKLHLYSNFRQAFATKNVVSKRNSELEILNKIAYETYSVSGNLQRVLDQPKDQAINPNKNEQAKLVSQALSWNSVRFRHWPKEGDE